MYAAGPVRTNYLRRGFVQPDRPRRAYRTRTRTMAIATAITCVSSLAPTSSVPYSTLFPAPTTSARVCILQQYAPYTRGTTSDSAYMGVSFFTSSLFPRTFGRILYPTINSFQPLLGRRPSAHLDRQALARRGARLVGMGKDTGPADCRVLAVSSRK